MQLFVSHHTSHIHTVLVTMRPDYTPFVTQVDNMFKKYDKYCGASCLFYMGHDKNRRTEYGLRMEAPSISKEFVDKVSFGRGEWDLPVSDAASMSTS